MAEHFALIFSATA